jgi:outer membrane protein OmpA-like peptidoglycan-associated protein
MKTVRILLALLALATVSACATPFEVAKVQDVMAQATPATGTEFSKALFDEYKEATREEALDEYEWRHAARYAEKAEAVAAGQDVQPEQPAQWDIPQAVLPVLEAARVDLMDDFAKGAKERKPQLAAKAQVSYDCWVEEESEGEANSACKGTFLDTEPQLKPPAPPVVAEVPLPPQPVVIYFEFGKAEITASAMQQLYDLAQGLKAAKLSTIHIHGFTDTVGGKGFNQKLSERRAKAVADQLKKLGIDAATIDVAGFGKDQLAFPTKNNVKEQRNRRAQVTWDPVR